MSKFKNIMKWLLGHMWIVGGALLLGLGLFLKSNFLKLSGGKALRSAKKSVKKSKEILKQAKKVHKEISTETDTVINNAESSIKNREAAASSMIRKKR